MNITFKKIFFFGAVFLFMTLGFGLSQEEKASHVPSKHHGHKKGAKGKKNLKSSKEGEFKLESQIRDSDVKFSFEEGKKKEKAKREKGRKRKKSSDSDGF